MNGRRITPEDHSIDDPNYRSYRDILITHPELILADGSLDLDGAEYIIKWWIQPVDLNLAEQILAEIRDAGKSWCLTTGTW